jgi:hypothetical protein
MAIDPISPSAVASALVPRLAGGQADSLAALAAGQTLDAEVVAILDTGEIRLSLLGVLLDMLPPTSGLEPGDAVQLTVVRPRPDLAVSLSPALPPGDADAASTLPDIPRESGEAGATGPALSVPPRGSRADAPPEARQASQDMVELSQVARSAARVVAAVDLPMPEGAAPPAKTLSTEARAALATVLPEAATGQQSRAPLLANAAALLAGPGGEMLPPPVRAMLAALVATAVDPHGLDGVALRQAIARSGTFQESSILKAAGLALGPSGTATPSAAMAFSDVRQDAKTLLLSLRSALRGAAAESAASAPAPAPPPPLPRKGSPLAAQAAAVPTLGADAKPPDTARTLLSEASGALDRVRLLQIASLPDAVRDGDPGRGARPLVEVPIALPGGQMPVMSLAVEREGRGPAGDGVGPTPTWRMRLSLDLDETGPIHALVSMKGEEAGVTLWAERPETASKFRAALPALRDAFAEEALGLDTLQVRDGAPAQPRAARAGSFLDRRT